MSLICPTCQTRIDPLERCPSTRGRGQCMNLQGHAGWHWTDIGDAPAILIWTGHYHKRSCPEHLGENDRWCVMTPGHDGPHHDGRGVSWGPNE